MMAPLETLARGAHLLREGDLTTRLRPVGQPEVDALVDVYNPWPIACATNACAARSATTC